MSSLTYDQAVETYNAHKKKLEKRLHSIKGNIKTFMSNEKKRYESKNRQSEQARLAQLETDLNS